MANNSLLTFMKGFTWTSAPSTPSDKSRHPGAPADFDASRESRELEPSPIPQDSLPDPDRRTIRVGKDKVQIDVEAVKQFVEKVKETHSSAA